jgi:hypothetical protein
MDPVLDVCVREPIMDPLLGVCVYVFSGAYAPCISISTYLHTSCSPPSGTQFYMLSIVLLYLISPSHHLLKTFLKLTFISNVMGRPV